MDGVPPETYYNNQRLRDFYYLISTNVDKKGRPFGSGIEAKNFPIFGTQYHPERQVFDFNPANKGLNKSFESEFANMAISQFYVNQTRYSNHEASNQTFLKDNLVYSFKPSFLYASEVVYYY